MDTTWRRRTRDRARQAWYAGYRQRRFARFLGLLKRDLGVTTGLTSPSLPYFAVKPFILLRDVEVPEGIPLAIEVGGS